MDETLKKSLIDLIDETIGEIEEMKKSRFAAAEIEIKGPGSDDLAGKPTNGKLDKEEDKDKDEEESEETEKSEEACKAEDEEVEEDEEETEEEVEKKDDDAKGGKEHEAKERKAIGELAELADMKLKKSQEETETLMKSYIDARMAPIESTLSSLLDAVSKLADAPVAPRGFTSKMVPLAKSADAETEVQPLSKSEIAVKLFDLKKSGTTVDSMDITKVELGQDLQTITKKYNLQ